MLLNTPTRVGQEHSSTYRYNSAHSGAVTLANLFTNGKTTAAAASREAATRLDSGGVLLLGLLDGVERLGVPGGLEDVVELLLHHRPLLQRPAGVLLVAEHHVLQDRLRHAQPQRDLWIR